MRCISRAVTLWAVVVMTAFGLATPVHAATYQVTSTADSGPGSLRAAIEAANANPGPDNIRFASSAYVEPIQLQDFLPTITDSVDIRGAGARRIVVDGGGIVRVLRIAPGASTVELRNMVLTNGNAAFGAGLYNQGPNTTLRNVHIIANDTTGDGGGVYDEGTLLMVDSLVLGNSAGDDGGGIFTDIGGNTRVVDTTVRGNSTYLSSASSNGGGLYVTSGTLSVERSLVEGNTASGNGGGLINVGGTLDVVNTTVVDNRSILGRGGGLSNDGTTTTVLHATITGNHDYSGQSTTDPADSAGGVHRYSGTINMTNTVISQNAAPRGGNANVNPANLNTNTSNFIGGDPLLGTLRDNGGDTHSRLPAANSPLTDAATNLGFTIDQRSFARPADGDGVGGAAPDIGAVERQADEPGAFALGDSSPTDDAVAPPDNDGTSLSEGGSRP